MTLFNYMQQLWSYLAKDVEIWMQCWSHWNRIANIAWLYPMLVFKMLISSFRLSAFWSRNFSAPSTSSPAAPSCSCPSIRSSTELGSETSRLRRNAGKGKPSPNFSTLFEFYTLSLHSCLLNLFILRQTVGLTKRCNSIFSPCWNYCFRSKNDFEYFWNQDQLKLKLWAVGKNRSILQRLLCNSNSNPNPSAQTWSLRAENSEFV